MPSHQPGIGKQGDRLRNAVELTRKQELEILARRQWERATLEDYQLSALQALVQGQTGPVHAHQRSSSSPNPSRRPPSNARRVAAAARLIATRSGDSAGSVSCGTPEHNTGYRSDTAPPRCRAGCSAWCVRREPLPSVRDAGDRWRRASHGLRPVSRPWRAWPPRETIGFWSFAPAAAGPLRVDRSVEVAPCLTVLFDEVVAAAPVSEHAAGRVLIHLHAGVFRGSAVRLVTRSGPSAPMSVSCPSLPTIATASSRACSPPPQASRLRRGLTGRTRPSS